MAKYGYQAPHEVHEFPSGLGYVDRNDTHDTAARRSPSLVDNRPLYGPHHVPENQYQALMEADFGEEPKMSADERQADWDGFQVKLDGAGLTEREMVVVDCIVFGQMSLSQAADALARVQGRNKPFSRQHIHRIRNSAYAKLRIAFEKNGDDE